jgi:FkbM family methyltransferase
MQRLLRGVTVSGIVDAGASNGRISQRLLKKFPQARIYAFEPNPIYRDTLMQFARGEQRFQPQFRALSDHEGIVDLHVTESPGSTSFFAPANNLKELDPQGAVVNHIEKVKAVRLDQWAERHDNLSIQLIKFDIQGGELLALNGAQKLLQNTVLLIYTEVLFNPLYENGAVFWQIDQFVRRFGFFLYDMYRPKYQANGSILWGSALYVQSHKLQL